MNFYGHDGEHRKCLEFQIYQYSILSSSNKDYDVACIFEYFLPLEGERRPDGIMLFEEKVIILEFKNKDSYKEDDISQVIGYRGDIFNYYKYTRDNNLEVESYLVLTKGDINCKVNNIQILNKHNFVYEIDFKNLNIIDTKTIVNKFG